MTKCSYFALKLIKFSLLYFSNNSAEENGNADGESSDDLLPSPPVSNIGQRCGSMLSAQPKVSWASVTDSRASGFIDLAQPSTSTDLNIPGIYTHFCFKINTKTSKCARHMLCFFSGLLV